MALGLVLALGFPLVAAAQGLTPEEVQKQREEAEKRKIEYFQKKRNVDHINERVSLYKEIVEAIPLEKVPGTSNLVSIYMNGHDIEDVARTLYFVSDDADETGFRNSYWPMVLTLNQASEYVDLVPEYAPLDAEVPEDNVAVLPNIRKQDYKAIVAQVTPQDSALALQLSTPVVQGYIRRLQDWVANVLENSGEPPPVYAPESLPGVSRLAVFVGTQREQKEAYPPRRLASQSGRVASVTSSDPVRVDQPLELDPAPPAWALRERINMLGPDYEGYNLQYTPDRLDLQPELGPIAMWGGVDSHGQPHTQPGMYFALNQRFFGFLLANESTFVVFSTAEAPSVNGLTLSAGLDFDLWRFSFAGMAGYSFVNLLGGTERGPSVAGKVRIPLTKHVYLGGVYRVTDIEKYQVEERDSGGKLVRRTGVKRPRYFGLGVTLR